MAADEFVTKLTLDAQDFIAKMKTAASSTEAIGSAFKQSNEAVKSATSSMKDSLAQMIASGQGASKEASTLREQLIAATSEAKKLAGASKQVEADLEAATTKGGGLLGGLKNQFSAARESATSGGGIFGSLAASAGSMVSPIGAVTVGIGALTAGVAASISIGKEFETGLQSVSAVTGVSGAALDDIGSRARNLAKEFGGSASDQLGVFQVTLSKIGPQLAQDSGALTTFAKNVNTLSKTDSALGAAGAVDALTGAMLQFGVNVNDSNEVARESSRFINVLAASAGVGSASVSDVAGAVAVVGATAKNANISFEETNAALQVLASKSLTGSMAGTALTTVINKMQAATGPAADQLKKMGTSSAELGSIITSKGIGPAIAKLRTAMDTLGSVAEKNAFLNGLFGEGGQNAAAALLGSGDMLKQFTEGVTGTTAATDQAKVNMNTFAETMTRLKSQFEDVAISVYQFILPALNFFASAISGVMTGLGAAFNGISFIISPAIDAIYNALKPIVDTVYNELKPAFDEAYNSIVGVFTGIGNAITNISAIIKPIIDNIYNSISSAFGGIVNSAAQLYSGIGGLSGIVSGAATALQYLAVAAIPIVGYFIGINAGVIANTAATIANTIATNASSIAAWALNAAKVAFSASTYTAIAATVAQTVSMGAVTAATWLWNAAQMALNFAMSLNPIGLVVAGIAALVAGIVYAYNHFESFRNVINSIWEKIKSFAETVWGFTKYMIPFTAAFTLAYDNIKPFRDFIDGLIQKLKDTGKAIGDFFSSIGNLFSSGEKKVEVTAEVKTEDKKEEKKDVAPPPPKKAEEKKGKTQLEKIKAELADIKQAYDNQLKEIELAEKRGEATAKQVADAKLQFAKQYAFEAEKLLTKDGKVKIKLDKKKGETEEDVKQIILDAQLAANANPIKLKTEVEFFADFAKGIKDEVGKIKGLISIDDMLSGGSDAKSAQRRIDDLISLSKSLEKTGQYEIAQETLKSANDLQNELTSNRRKASFQRREIEVNAMQTGSNREFQIKLLALDKQYVAELEAAEKIGAATLEITKRYNAAVAELKKGSAADTIKIAIAALDSEGARTLATKIVGLQKERDELLKNENATELQRVAIRKRYDKEISDILSGNTADEKQLKKEERDLATSLAKREISFLDYTKKVSEKKGKKGSTDLDDIATVKKLLNLDPADTQKEVDKSLSPVKKSLPKDLKELSKASAESLTSSIKDTEITFDSLWASIKSGAKDNLGGVTNIIGIEKDKSVSKFNDLELGGTDSFVALAAAAGASLAAIGIASKRSSDMIDGTYSLLTTTVGDKFDLMSTKISDSFDLAKNSAVDSLQDIGKAAGLVFSGSYVKTGKYEDAIGDVNKKATSIFNSAAKKQMDISDKMFDFSLKNEDDKKEAIKSAEDEKLALLAKGDDERTTEETEKLKSLDVSLAQMKNSTSTAFESMGTAAALSFGAMLASGKNATDALKTVVLDTAGKLLETYVAPILASFFAFLGPFALPAALAAVGLVKGLLSSAVSKFETGGEVEGGQQLIQVNEAGTETVMNARATRENRDLFRHLNAGGKFDTFTRGHDLSQVSVNQSGGLEYARALEVQNAQLLGELKAIRANTGKVTHGYQRIGIEVEAEEGFTVKQHQKYLNSRMSRG